MEKETPKIFKDISSAFEKFSLALKGAFTPNSSKNATNKEAENASTILTSLPLEIQYHVFSLLKRNPSVQSNQHDQPDPKNVDNEVLPTLDQFYDNDLLKISRNPRSRCVLCSIRTSCKTYRDLVNDFHHPSSHDFENKVTYWEYNTSEHNMFMAKSVKLKYLMRIDPINKKFHYVELHWDPSAQNLNYSILYAGLIHITKVCLIDDGSLAYRAVGTGKISFAKNVLTLYKLDKPAGEFVLSSGELKFKTKSLIQPMPKKFYRSKPDLMQFPRHTPVDEDDAVVLKSTMELMNKIAEKIAENENESDSES